MGQQTADEQRTPLPSFFISVSCLLALSLLAVLITCPSCPASFRLEAASSCCPFATSGLSKVEETRRMQSLPVCRFVTLLPLFSYLFWCTMAKITSSSIRASNSPPAASTAATSTATSSTAAPAAPLATPSPSSTAQRPSATHSRQRNSSLSGSFYAMSDDEEGGYNTVTHTETGRGVRLLYSKSKVRYCYRLRRIVASAKTPQSF